MATTVEILPTFNKLLKRLGRKYPGVAGEVRKLVRQLENDQRPGDRIPHVGDHDVYKVRLRNPSAGRGKSGGFRVIYYVQVADKVYLLTVYSKTEQADISPETISAVLAEIPPPKHNDDD